MTHHPDDAPLLALEPPVDCAAFERRLADYLEGDLPPALRVAAETHRSGCQACAALVADLDRVRDLAAALPLLHPSRDLWDGVAARISAPVVPIAVAGTPAAAARRPWLHRPWLAAAAALLLVGSTATLTYTVASRAPLDGPVASAPTVAVGPEPVTVVRPAPPADAMPAVATPEPTPPAAEPARAGAPSRTRLAADAAPAVPASPYDREIAQLRAVLDRQRSTLDTGTVRVVQRNLAIIDQAIRESRDALARDPSSQFLNQQLTDMLGEKLELMRTAVLLSGADD